ncbi:unnamed protein product [Auanema sp. JU1783]|nr:unnamed protein product [Auanema sp. JU1783]
MHLSKKRREMVQKLENEVTDVVAQKNPPSPKSRLGVLRRNKKASNASDPFRFEGQGVTYKGKLIGERDVEGARGDGMCAEAMRIAKAAVKAAGAHKTRIHLQINIDGIKIVDEKSNAVIYNFPVSRISFIARDTSDARAFGLVFGDTGNKYKFYGIKTAQTADQAVLAIRDMFQVVFEMKKKHIEQVKQQQENPTECAEAGGAAVADLLDLETELHNIEQGVQQLQQIPTDPFGSKPFNDPFTDSFASNTSSVMSNSMSMNSFANTSIPQQVPQQQQSLFGFQSPAQVPNQQAWAQTTPTGLLTTQPQQQTYQTACFNNTSPFSQTNPFASAAYGSDPFSSHNAPQIPSQAPVVPVVAPTYQTSIDWGVNENAVPQNQAINFASFDSFSQPAKQDYKWDEPKGVTSLEEAFSKLVDMDSIVGPTETKKNPFDHILNPPKATLNSLGAQRAAPQPVMVAPSNSDPFGDDFFR